MIFGAHSALYSTAADADRRFFSDILGLKSVDAGRGWLIFALPPPETAFHPAEGGGTHELFFMCDDLKAEMATLAEKKVLLSEIREARWGGSPYSKCDSPAAGNLSLYQPRHAMALDKP